MNMRLSNVTKSAVLFAAMLTPFGGSQAFAEDGINIGGAVRVNYGLKFYDEASKDKGGDLTFDMLALTFNGKHGNWGLASEYRFTSYGDYLKKGYLYYSLASEWELQFGINNVPFGNREYISNSFWLGIPYYLGLEDDFDVGVKATFDNGNWHSDFAFYKNPEYGPGEINRYAADLYSGKINGTQYANEETNQLNFRQTYTLTEGDLAMTLGGSVEVGQIYNSISHETGDRYAVALHLDSSYQGWNLQLQAMEYEYDARNQPDVDSNKIGISVVGWQYEIASKGQVYHVNLAKSFATSWGSVKVYNDFGYMTPDTDDESFDNSLQNVTGMAIAAGPIYTMVDFVMGQNMTFATEKDDHVGLPEAGDGWDKRININFGYYF
ncbi:hypothetical protein [Shewanella insulae]|uniref:hypothetical protein n=1 Tax=Shewanella insulae TaxID=2681496 RepID=UPI003CE4A2B3